MLAIASNCSTLQIINHYKRKDAIEWDIFIIWKITSYNTGAEIIQIN
jgi:hypothetical protein